MFWKQYGITSKSLKQYKVFFLMGLKAKNDEYIVLK